MTKPSLSRRLWRTTSVGILASALLCSGGLTTIAAANAAPPLASAQKSVATVVAGEAITPSAFKNPAMEFRPAIRWWWQAPLSLTESVREITAIGDAGYGEVEIAFSAGAWADQAQRDNLAAVLAQADQLGIKVSMTMGAAWPVQTPNTSAGTEFVQKEMQYGSVDVRGGALFNAAAPTPFDDPTLAKANSKLVAVTIARVIKRGPAPRLLPVAERPRFGSPIVPPSESTILDPDSVKDVTATVVDGKLNWRAPKGSDWIVFGMWQRDAAKAVTSAFEPEAAEAATQYLDQNQIGAQNTDGVKQSGATMFEDSLELNADSLFWAPQFEDSFADNFGYDMAAYLPLMFQHGMSRYWVPTVEPRPDFDFPEGEGKKVRNDYYSLITGEYINRSKVFQDWAETTYGVNFKSQPAFGQDLDPIRSAREFAADGIQVEGESFNSGDRFPVDMSSTSWKFALDWQRVVASGVHQGGQNLISTELGAQRDRTYEQHLTDYKQMMDKEWAAGFTKPYVHGFAYQPENTPWPGKQRFGDSTADSWNDSFPEWADMPKLTDYWARGTEVLQTGTPRVDVAIYRDGFLTTAARLPADEGTSPSELFNTKTIEKKGYSIEFVDPKGLAGEGVVGDGVLFPEGPQYQALVIDEKAISADAATALAAAVDSGLRVVFVGDLPSKDITYGSGAEGDAIVQDAVAHVMASKNVVRVDYQADVASALAGLDVTPRVSWTTNQRVLTQTRVVDGMTYVYLYNPTSDDVDFTPSIKASGAASVMDLQTGEIRPADTYTGGDGRTTIPTRLAPLETRVYSIDSSSTALHVTSTTNADDKFVYANGTITLKSTESGTRTVTLSNGRTKTLKVEPVKKTLATVGPYQWGLTVDAVTPTGTKAFSIPTLAGTGNPLWDWRSIPQISQESGTGTYTGTATIPATWLASGKGVYLNLGVVQGSARAYVNGKYVGLPLTDNKPWDVTPYLVSGANTVKVEVRTTLRNAVTQYAKTASRTQASGLRGPVEFTPFAAVSVWDPAVEPADSTVTVTTKNVAFGTAVPVTVKVATSEGPAATGYVSILEGGKEIAAARLTSAGTASLKLAGLSVGSHKLQAAYEGSNSVLASTADFSVTVSKATSAVGVKSVSNAKKKTITSTVTVASAAPNKSGTVTVTVSGKKVATAKVATNGRATVVITKVKAGTAKYAYTYSGNSTTAGSKVTKSIKMPKK